MDVLSSRILLGPSDPDRSRRLAAPWRQGHRP